MSSVQCVVEDRDEKACEVCISSSPREQVAEDFEKSGEALVLAQLRALKLPLVANGCETTVNLAAASVYL